MLELKDKSFTVGHKNDYEKIMLLCVMLWNFSVYKSDFDETK